MSKLALSAHGLSYTFPGNTPLFSDLNLHLNAEHYALVGRNGVGKSFLMSLLAGRRRASRGSVTWHQTVLWLSQQAADVPDNGTVAQYLGVQETLAALLRLDTGEGSATDVEVVGEQWSLRDTLTSRLTQFELPWNCLDRPLATLSGGQRTRLALMALAPSPEHFLLLDEPTNHLDQDSRHWLRRWLFAHPGGSLTITHDQDMLQHYENILELRNGRLFHYGAGLEDFELQRQRDRDNAEAELKHARQTLQKERAQLQQEKERQAKRQSQGSARAAKGGMPKILLGAMKARSESTAGKIKDKHQETLAHEQARARNALEKLEQLDPLHFALTPPALGNGVIVRVDGLCLPHIQMPPICMQIHAGQRWRIRGRNGSGKSILLRVLAGELPATEGERQVRGRLALLDQHLSFLEESENAVANFQRLNPGWTEQAYRDKLAQIRLRRDRALLAVSSLSGGERLKLALAILTMGPLPIDLLLLDEPDNHLDLESQALLAETLRAYTGTLIMVTHSDALAASIGFTQEWLMDAPT